VSITNEKVCPRCGKPYSSIKEVKRGGRVYLYAAYYEETKKVNGKKHASKPRTSQREPSHFRVGRRSASIIIP